MRRTSPEFPPELHQVADQLETERPIATPAELRTMKAAARLRANDRSGRSLRKEAFTKSRLAITAMLALGVLLSGTGATLAVTGLSGDGGSGAAQYGQPGQGGQPGQPGQPGQDQGGQQGEAESGGGADQGAAEDEAAVGGEGKAGAARAGEQVAATGEDSLPFAGFAAVPLLVGGVALLGTGAVLRRRSSV